MTLSKKVQKYSTLWFEVEWKLGFPHLKGPMDGVKGSLVQRILLPFFFLIFVIGDLSGMSFFVSPNQGSEKLTSLKVSVVNGSTIDMKLGQGIGVFATPFPENHPQLMEADGESKNPEKLDLEQVKLEDRVLWEVVYNLFGHREWFSEKLPQSRRVILLVGVGSLVCMLLFWPRRMIWGMSLLVLSALLFLPDYSRKVLLIRENGQIMFGPALEGEIKLSVTGKRDSLIGVKTDFDKEAFQALTREKNAEFSSDSVRVRGIVKGFWSEILVLDVQ